MQNNPNDIVLPFILIFFGIIAVNKKTMISFIKFGNQIRGVKTEITNKTLLFWKLTGVLIMVLGLLYLITFLI